MPRRSPKSHLKPPRTSRKVGELLQSGQAVVDERGIVRTLPSSTKLKRIPVNKIKKHMPLDSRRKRFLDGIQRKVEAQRIRASQPQLPKTIPRHQMIRILKDLGFKQTGSAKYFSQKHGAFTLPASAGAKSVNVRKAPMVKKLIIAWLSKKGNKL